MRHRLHLAAAALLLTTGAAHPQIHSPQINIHRQHAAQDLTWLWQYTQPAPVGQKSAYRENDLVNDPRFKPFLKQNLTTPQTFWGKGTPLPDVARDFLALPGDVIGENVRYITADGCVQHFCPNRGLLWIDLGLPQPLVVFAAIDWISDNRATQDKDAAYTMWVFSNQPLDPAHIPAALVRSIARWTAQPSSGSTDLQNITRVLLVDPDGTPHTLGPSAIGAHNALPAETSNAPSTELTPIPDTAPKAKP